MTISFATHHTHTKGDSKIYWFSTVITQPTAAGRLGHPRHKSSSHNLTRSLLTGLQTAKRTMTIIVKCDSVLTAGNAQRERQTERQTQRETERQTETDRERQTEREYGVFNNWWCWHRGGGHHQCIEVCGGKRREKRKGKKRRRKSTARRGERRSPQIYYCSFNVDISSWELARCHVPRNKNTVSWLLHLPRRLKVVYESGGLGALPSLVASFLTLNWTDWPNTHDLNTNLELSISIYHLAWIISLKKCCLVGALCKASK